MQITESVFMLDCANNGHVFLIKGEENILIDTGMPGLADHILEELETLSVQPNDVHKILLTHHDIDHIGNARILQEATNAQLYAPFEDMPYILKEKKEQV